MAKRFTDTDKWKKPFIKSLPMEYKLLWFYILDDCDHAGLWQVDIEVAQIRLGVKLSEKQAVDFFSGKVIVFDNNTKWFIPDFINFQYNGLNEKNKLYPAISKALTKYNLIPHLSPIDAPSNPPSDGVKEKEQGKRIRNKEKEQEKEQDNAWKFFVDEWFKFYEERVGVKPKFDPAQAAALKSIKKHLEDVSTGNPEDSWHYILKNWHKQDEWMQSQLDLKIINSKFNNVLNSLKNGNSKTKPVGGDTAAAFSKIDQFYSQT